ncbi:MAG: PP2C family protein-serine/threonine phosphatase, partial [bacterium]
DGMGGHAGGALAAEAVIESAQEAWHSLSAASLVLPKDFLAATCTRAHKQIREIGRQHGVFPKSTCIFLYLSENQAHWAYVGDSRLYHVRDGRILFRTRDHSVVQMLADKGKIKEKETGRHRDQNRLLQALGSEDGVVPDFGFAQLKWEDTFLLCSDGLWEVFSPEEIESWMGEGLDPEAVEQWVEEAVRRGGENGDNVSLVLAKWKQNAP